MSPTNTIMSSTTEVHRAAVGLPVAKFKKAQRVVPQPPKRLRSAFIIFSAEKHKEIRAGLEAQGITEKVCMSKVFEAYHLFIIHNHGSGALLAFALDDSKRLKATNRRWAKLCCDVGHEAKSCFMML